MLSVAENEVIHVIYDLMEKAQDPTMDMIKKWDKNHDRSDVVQSLLKDGLITFKHNMYWVSDKGYEAMAEYNKKMLF